MNFHESLRTARLRACKTQQVVAEAVGITSAALSNYETGYREPDLDTLTKMAAFYGIPVDALLGVQTDKNESRDLWSLCTGEEVRFLGTDYPLSEFKRQALRELLSQFFEENIAEQTGDDVYEELEYSV